MGAVPAIPVAVTLSAVPVPTVGIRVDSGQNVSPRRGVVAGDSVKFSTGEGDVVAVVDLDGTVVIAGKRLSLALVHTHCVGGGVEGIQTVLENGCLAAWQIDQNLPVMLRMVDADIRQAATDADLRAVRVSLDGLHGCTGCGTHNDPFDHFHLAHARTGSGALRVAALNGRGRRLRIGCGGLTCRAIGLG